MNKLDIVNQILGQFRESPVKSLTDAKLFEFPWYNIEDLLNEAIVDFSNRNSWGWTLTETQLNYTPQSGEFNLTDYNIDYNRIHSIYYILGTYPAPGFFYYLSLINRQLFKRTYPNSTTLSKPLLYSQEDDNLFIFPTPDADYKITVKHYQQLPYLKTSTDIIPMIPEKHQKAIIYDISSTLANILGKNNAQALNFNYIECIGNATQTNQTFLQSPNKMSSKIRWGV
jgi:hypothetical protein